MPFKANNFLKLLTFGLLVFSFAANANLLDILRFCQSKLTKVTLPVAQQTVYVEITDKTNIVKMSTNDRAVEFPVVTITVGQQVVRLEQLVPMNIQRRAWLDFSINIKGKKKPIHLPKAMQQTFLDYLRLGGSVSKEFDCNCFVHYLNGMPFEYGSLYLGSWNLSEFEEESLSIGDSIILEREFLDFSHLAIYLGDGLYLSKFGGNGGSVLVTDLHSIKQAYESNKIWRAVPR